MKRFWDKVDRRGVDECWEWTAALHNTGYGAFLYENKRLVVAHRFAAFLVGLVDSPYAPTNKLDTGFVMHRCDNRKCCNPKHLRVGTYADNNADRIAKGRANASNNTKPRLFDKQREWAKQQRHAGITIKVIATKLGVCERTITRLTKDVA